MRRNPVLSAILVWNSPNNLLFWNCAGRVAAICFFLALSVTIWLTFQSPFSHVCDLLAGPYPYMTNVDQVIAFHTEEWETQFPVPLTKLQSVVSKISRRLVQRTRFAIEGCSEKNGVSAILFEISFLLCFVHVKLPKWFSYMVYYSFEVNVKTYQGLVLKVFFGLFFFFFFCCFSKVLKRNHITFVLNSSIAFWVPKSAVPFKFNKTNIDCLINLMLHWSQQSRALSIY